jgi:dTDP-4-amino-4,6-dideoxygalactose transaminase
MPADDRTLQHDPAASDGSERIPFNRPSLEGRELEYIAEAVGGGHTSSSGPFAKRASALVQEALDARDVLLTTSCTAALELSALLLDLEPGDTVVVPSFTFVTTGLAFVRAGARLRFCDIEPTTLGLDPAHLADLMDSSVRAVVPVHYAGVGCDLEGIVKVLGDHPRAQLVEDNAHGLFGSYRDRPLGTFGRFSTLSFHETKNFICGEGGALVVNDAADVDRAHVLFDKGTNRRAFMLGAVDKYSWQDTGSSFGLSDVLSGYLYGQLEQREAILANRRRVFERYRSLLGPFADTYGFTTPVVPPDREQAYHMFYVLLPDRLTRDRVLADLRERNIHATFHYVPLHSSAGAERFCTDPVPCPVTDDVSGRLLRLPFYNRLSDGEVDRVAGAFLEALSAGS